ncbi:MAG: helix-turn-helix transcriptional regulator [Candidatus Izemoplasma sp.]|nr:helix-turn-helix transcriptional regulator [Candidatus Izemoplasma sp.]
MDKLKIKGQSPISFIRYYLYDYRKTNDYTMEDMAEMMGISLNYYGDLEKGNKGEKMSIHTAYKIAQALQVSLDNLYLLEEEYQERILL